MFDRTNIILNEQMNSIFTKLYFYLLKRWFLEAPTWPPLGTSRGRHREILPVSQEAAHCGGSG